MAPLPVIANVFRVSMPWQGGIVHPVNVFHVKSATSSTASDVGDAIDEALLGLTGDPWNSIHEDYTCPTLEIIELDGASATFAKNLDHIPQGAATGPEVPNTCGVVSFHTDQRGSRGRGRMYVGPVGEDIINDGELQPSNAADMLTGWEELITNLPSSTPSLQLVIASYVHADSHQVTSVRVDNILGTQRRRQDQLR